MTPVSGWKTQSCWITAKFECSPQRGTECLHSSLTNRSVLNEESCPYTTPFKGGIITTLESSSPFSSLDLAAQNYSMSPPFLAVTPVHESAVWKENITINKNGKGGRLPVTHKEGVRFDRERCLSVSRGVKVVFVGAKSLIRARIPIRPTRTHLLEIDSGVFLSLSESVSKNLISEKGPRVPLRIFCFLHSTLCQKALARKSFSPPGTVWRLFSVNTEQRAWKNPSTTINHSGRTETASLFCVSLCPPELQLEWQTF